MPAWRSIARRLLHGAAVMALVVPATTACSGSPTSAGDDGPVPTGIILAGTPNGPETGTYLIDIASGDVTRIVEGFEPLSVAFQGGYSRSLDVVYGLTITPPIDQIKAISLDSNDTSIVVTMRQPSTLAGAYDLSSDGHVLAIQTGEPDKVQLSIVNLVTGVWAPIVDQTSRLDTIPLASIRWSPDGETLFAVTEGWPGRTELVRIDPATQVFTIISPSTREYGTTLGRYLSGRACHRPWRW